MLEFDLQPTETIPDVFKDYLTFAEISKIRRDTAAGRYAGKPIPEGAMPSTYRAFTSWSLFLITNPAWLREDGHQIESLRQAYWGFARVIGGHHAAVWFAKKLPEGEGINAAQIDSERCTLYAESLHLDLRKGPHIVVSLVLPSLEKPFTPAVVLELSSLSPSSTQTLLTELANQLVNSGLSEAALKSTQWRLKWKDAATKALQMLGELARWVTITISSKGEASIKIASPEGGQENKSS